MDTFGNTIMSVLTSSPSVGMRSEGGLVGRGRGKKSAAGAGFRRLVVRSSLCLSTVGLNGGAYEVRCQDS